MKKILYFLMVALTLSVATMSLSSCEDEGRIKWSYKGSNGPWDQNDANLIIYYEGGDWYTVYDIVSRNEVECYLERVYDFEYTAPNGVDEVSYYAPYWNSFYEVLGWWVETNRGNYWINPESGTWMPK